MTREGVAAVIGVLARPGQVSSLTELRHQRRNPRTGYKAPLPMPVSMQMT